MQEKFEFELKKSLKVHGQIDGKNEFVELNKLYLKAPTYKHRDKTIGLKQAFLTAEELRNMKILATGVYDAVQKMKNEMPNQKNSKNKEDDQEVPEETIRSVLFKSGEDCINLSKFFDKFTNLLTSNICFKDEECENVIKTHELQELAEEDFENLVVEYIKVFFTSSWLKRTN